MAQNEVKVKVTADSTAIERTLSNLKERIAQTFSNPSTFSLNNISPWKVIADGISNAIRGFINDFMEAEEKLLMLGKSAERLGEKLGTSSLEASRLESAARAAGVNAKDYAEALERIESGKTTLAEQAEAWERVASGAKLSKERSRGLAALITAEKERISEEATNAAKVYETISGIGNAGKVAERIAAEIERGRREPVTAQEIMRRGTTMGYTLTNLGGGENINLAVVALNRGIREAQEAETKAKEESEKRAEAERKRKEAEQRKAEAEAARLKAEEQRIAEADHKEEATRKAQAQAEINAEKERSKREEEALADRIAKAYTQLLDIVGGEAEGMVKEAFGLDDETMNRLLALGLRRAQTPEALLQEEIARGLERQQERQRAQAERDRLTERAEDLRRRADEVEGELNASWLTASGGSLIGNGAFSLAMGQRMRDIDRAEKQAELLQELHGVNEKLAQLVKNTNE